MDFTMFAGDTRRINFSIKRPDGSPLDLTGATVRWQASKLKPTGIFSATPTFEKTDGSGVEVVDTANGLVTVTLEPQDTVDKSGVFYQEMETVDYTGDVATVYTGQFEIKKALIKPLV